MNRTTARRAALALTSLLVAACSSSSTRVSQPTTTAAAPASSSSASSSAPPGTTSFSVSISEPAALDPALTAEVEGAQVVRLLYQTLTRLSPDLEVQPGAATSWDVAADGVTWTFHLDPKGVFSDGNPVTAADFAYEFARAADPDLASAAGYQGLPIKGWSDVNSADASGKVGDVPVAGVTAVDDHTLQIVTAAPFGLLPKLLTYPIFAPVERATVEGDKAKAFADQPIGNGLYRMAGPWQHNESITVVRNERFTGTPGVVDEIDFKIYADIATAYKDFQAGNLDIDRGIPATEIESARRTYGEAFHARASALLNYIGLPTNLAPFDDVDMRTALSLAIDRKAIADEVYHGSQTPAVGVVPPLVPGALTDPCAACVYDPDKAKELFAKAGGKPGLKIVLLDNADDGQDFIEPIINGWKTVLGIDVEVQSYPFAQLLDTIAGGKSPGAFELGWVWDYPSGYSMLAPLYETGAEANNFNWSNPAFDADMKQVREAKDEQSALPFLADGEKIVDTELPVIPVTFGEDLGLTASRLTNVKIDTGSLWRLELIGVTG